MYAGFLHPGGLGKVKQTRMRRYAARTWRIV